MFNKLLLMCKGDINRISTVEDCSKNCLFINLRKAMVPDQLYLEKGCYRSNITNKLITPVTIGNIKCGILLTVADLLM